MKTLDTPNILELMEISVGDRIAELIAPSRWCGRRLPRSTSAENKGRQSSASGGFIAFPGAELLLQTGDVLLGKSRDIDAVG